MHIQRRELGAGGTPRSNGLGCSQKGGLKVCNRGVGNLGTCVHATGRRDARQRAGRGRTLGARMVPPRHNRTHPTARPFDWPVEADGARRRPSRSSLRPRSLCRAATTPSHSSLWMPHDCSAEERSSGAHQRVLKQ